MTTISVPLPIELAKKLDDLVRSGYGSNKADAVRRAIDLAAKEEAIRIILQAQKEPSLRGDLRELMKKIK